MTRCRRFAVVAAVSVRLDAAERRVVLTVALPDISAEAGKQVELDVGDSELRAQAPGHVYGVLTVALHEHGLPEGEVVDRAATKAKWMKKTNSLRVTLGW